MADHSKFAATATRLISKHGRFITMQTLSATAADPTKPWKGAGTPTVASQVANVPAVFVPSYGSDLGRTVVSEELLKRVEQIALVAPLQEGLETMHLIIDTDGQVWKIDWAQVLKPADKTVLYVIGVTR